MDSLSSRVLGASKETFGPVGFHCLDTNGANALILSGPRQGFRYVVTPNIDHIVRLNSNVQLRPFYASAWMSLNDSRLLQLLMRPLGVRLPLARGSDLVEQLLPSIAQSNGSVAIVGSDEAVIAVLKAFYPDLTIQHYNPAMGFYEHPALISDCVDFVRAAQADYTFFAVGSPQQEMLAYQCLLDGRCRGVGLCVGAALRMLTGHEIRAPWLIRDAGLEWLFRVARDPKRLWRRYFLRDPQVVILFVKEAWRRIRLGRSSAESGAKVATGPSTSSTTIERDG